MTVYLGSDFRAPARLCFIDLSLVLAATLVAAIRSVLGFARLSLKLTETTTQMTTDHFQVPPVFAAGNVAI